MDADVRRSLIAFVITIAAASVYGHRWPWLAAATITTAGAVVALNAHRARRAGIRQ